MAMSRAMAEGVNGVLTFPSPPKVVSKSPGDATAGIAGASRAKARTATVVVPNRWTTLAKDPIAPATIDPDSIVVPPSPAACRTRLSRARQSCINQPSGGLCQATWGRPAITWGGAMSDKDEGGLSSFLGKAAKWLE